MNNSQRMSVCLTPVFGQEADDFSLSQLIGPKYYRVLRIITQSNQHIVLECDSNELLHPDSDPLIIGTINKKIVDFNGKSIDDHQPRVLWDSRLWRTLDANTEELFNMLTGIKPEAMKKFAENLRDPRHHLRLQSASS